MSQSPRFQEIVKCGKDPVHFMNAHVKIQHPTRGSLPFKTYRFQDQCVNLFKDNRFSIVVKSRQLGLSTVTAAYVLWYMLFHRDKNIMVIANKGRVAKNFLRKVKYAYEKLSDYVKIAQIKTSTVETFELTNGSVVKAVATTEDAGRSEALSLLIIDEAAIINKFEEIWTATYPTLSEGGSAIVFSTPKGIGNQFHTLYSEAVNGTNGFKYIELPWNVHPEHDQRWFEKESANMTRKQMAQEFLCDFISSGDTFLQIEEMEKVRGMISQPISKEGRDMGVWVWKRPEPGHSYIMSADVARGDSADCSTFHIVDVADCDVVAEYKGKLAPDMFGDLMIEYGLKYNNALACPEHNSFGYATAMRLRDAKYPSIHYEEKWLKPGQFGQKEPIEGAIPGITTHKNNRSIIVSKLEEMIRNNKLQLHSSRTLDELKTFVWIGSKPQALANKNDDLVMSLAIACWLHDQLYGDRTGKVSYDSANLLKYATVRKNTMMPVDAQMRQAGMMWTVPRPSAPPKTIGGHHWGWLLR